MREHCRTQHGYDPEPVPRPPPERQQRTTDLINSTVSAPVEKFLKMMAYSRFQQTGIKDSTGNSIVNSMGSIENALNYLLDNFAIVRKNFRAYRDIFVRSASPFNIDTSRTSGMKGLQKTYMNTYPVCHMMQIDPPNN